MITALYDKHVALGAKLTSFSGWEMPLHYPQGILHEHHIVRTAAGLFDVSHMGRISITGPDAEEFLEHLTTNRILGKAPLSTTYTVLTNASGGAIDDSIVYKIEDDRFFIVANANNREMDYAHLQKESRLYEVILLRCYQNEGILALQGPLAKECAMRLFPEIAALKPHRFLLTSWKGEPLIISETGYTGAGGCEFFAPFSILAPLWDELLHAGAEPVGLGARDLLRLEMGYALYGHELSESIAPTESVAAWTVKWDKEFLGKDKLLELENSGKKRHAYGAILKDKGIAREGFYVFKGEQQIGKVTSGSYSPSLEKSIALILVSQFLNPGELIEIQIRDKRVPAEIAHLPFLK